VQTHKGEFYSYNYILQLGSTQNFGLCRICKNKHYVLG
jgi:hypothetical protein